jgi:hypothetical protein
MQSAISDVIIARYEDWLRATGRYQPDSFLTRIETGIRLASASIDALLAAGRGSPGKEAEPQREAIKYPAELVVPREGWMLKPRGRGSMAGRGREVQVVMVQIPTELEESPELPADDQNNGPARSERDIAGMSPSDRSRARKIAIIVAVSVAALAVPGMLTWRLRRMSTKRSK